MTLDDFGEKMEKLITENDVAALIKMPAGTTDAEIQTNMPGGGVVELYLLLSAIPSAVKHMAALAGIIDPETTATGICELVYNDLVKAIREVQNDAEADV